jgi:hypothetical protein
MPFVLDEVRRSECATQHMCTARRASRTCHQQCNCALSGHLMPHPETPEKKCRSRRDFSLPLDCKHATGTPTAYRSKRARSAAARKSVQLNTSTAVSDRAPSDRVENIEHDLACYPAPCRLERAGNTARPDQSSNENANRRTRTEACNLSWKCCHGERLL